MRYLLILILLPLHLPAQDFTGYWKGTLHTSGNELPYELAISEQNGKLIGYSMTLFTIEGKEQSGVKAMKIKAKKGTLTIEDGELLYDTYSKKSKRVMLYSILTLYKEDTGYVLAGDFSSRAFNNPTYKGTVKLKRISSYSGVKMIPVLEQLQLVGNLSFLNPAAKNSNPDNKGGKNTIPVKRDSVSVLSSTVARPAAEVEKRKIETIQSIVFESDSLKLSLFDNGQVDGDTVSVVFNGETIISRQGLTGKGITKTIHIPQNRDTLQLVMYAENLGLIPPNTGLLIIEDGEKRYEVRFASDLQKNSAVTLSRERL